MSVFGRKAPSATSLKNRARAHAELDGDATTLAQAQRESGFTAAVDRNSDVAEAAGAARDRLLQTRATTIAGAAALAAHFADELQEFNGEEEESVLALRALAASLEALGSGVS